MKTIEWTMTQRQALGALATGMAVWASMGVPRPAAAQEEVRLELRAGQVVDERGAESRGMTAGASVLSAGALAWGQVRVEGTLPSAGGWLGALGGSFGSSTSSTGVGLGVTGAVSAVTATGGYLGMSAAVAPSVRLGGRSGHVQAGPTLAVASERAGDGLADPGPGSLPPLGRPGADSHMTMRMATGLQAEAAGRAGAMSWGTGWSTTGVGDQRWHDLAGRLALDVGEVAVQIGGGRRMSAAGEELWGVGRVALRLGTSLELVGEGGRSPSDPLTGRLGGTYAGVGLALVTGRGVMRRAAVAPAPVPAGRIELRLAAAPGARVELMGDWTNWAPVHAVEIEPGVFVVRTRLENGRYRFGYRVDGEWRVPAGYAVEEDGYGGRNALIEVGAATSAG